MTKLLYITNGITGAGGLERVLAVKASLLAEQFGYQVHILSLNEPVSEPPFFDFSPKIIRHSLSVSGSPLNYLRQYMGGIKKIMALIEPDVISVCDDGLKGFFIPKIIGRKVPVIYERHVSRLIEESAGQNVLSRLRTTLKFRLMNGLAKSFDRFVVLTEGNTAEWDLPNMLVIPNPLPFYPSLSAPLQNKKVIAVGKQSYQKAYDLLLQAWSRVPHSLNEWELHVYGKIEQELKLDRLAEQLGLGGRVFFHPPETNIENRFLESSVFVLSSRFEGFGMVIIEAMACGLPVVSFDCPHGPADIITSGTDGFLIENGNTEQFSDKLGLLMDDFELRKKFGAAAKQTVKNYLPQKIGILWDNLFKTILNDANHKS